MECYGQWGIAAAIGLALAGAGCGGDDDERSAADFIAEGSPGIRVRTSPVSGHGVVLVPNPKIRTWVLDWLAARLR